ncbi:hypothetical protein [Serinibacter arcticus]|uniref:hypothetical protein n=1 Tax=Serinibacter arcticus TaxID=1655435 RepID=UPI001304A8F3|nr:hypothetical protein [Serinibacter arcticus]
MTSSLSSPRTRPTRRDWVSTLVPAAIALLVVTGLILAGAAIASRGVALVGGLISGG